MPLSLLDWLQERYDNCIRIAAQKTGADKDGWLEDAEYFEDAISAVRAERDNPQGTPIAYQCTNCGVLRWRQFEACVCGAATWQHPGTTWTQLQHLKDELAEAHRPRNRGTEGPN